nr:hypothetical protein [Tanacetum cinerariifolium]
MLHLLRVEMVINSPWMMSKNWLVQKQMAFGKDISNLFMADNMTKIVWFSTHHVTFMKSWLVQKQTVLGQTTTGKENSNPFMAGVNTPRSDEDRLKLMELMVFLLQKGNQIGDLSTHTTSYISPALTQKVFANMRRVRKGFSGVETPLFKGMLAARTITEEGIAEEQVQVDDDVAATVQESIAEDIANEAIPSTPTPLILPSPPSYDIPSPSQDIGKRILIETPKPMKKKDQIELDAEYARKLHEEINKDHKVINKDIDWDAAIDHVKQKSKENPQCIKRYQ